MGDVARGSVAVDYASLYQINTRILLQERSTELGRAATLDDVPDEMLDVLADQGFAWVWLLGVWQTGEVGRAVSAANPSLREGYTHELPDVRDEDICGSPFAVQSYTTHKDFGGDAALARLRTRLAKRGMRLILDFVVNHTAPDHPRVTAHPEYYVHGTDEELRREPQNYTRIRTDRGEAVYAYGRDPYFAGWPDTLQLNYRHAGAREAMGQELLRIADRCDGVRCDMAMLVNPEVFLRTWGDRARPSDGSSPVDRPFWPEVIRRVHWRHPQFLFIAEVYWDMEWALQQDGFDFTYDKRLYDRLREGHGKSVREHLQADRGFQDRSLRFLENHDEPRASATFAPEQHRAAAVVTYFVPGLRFFHEGQFEGRKVHASMHLRRRPAEQPDPRVHEVYMELLADLHRPEVHSGTWRLWMPKPAWEGNPTWEQFIVFSWQGESGYLMLAAVNYGPTQGQCYATIDVPSLANGPVVLSDTLSPAAFERDGRDLQTKGLYLDMPAYGAHLFQVTPAAA